MFDPHTRESRGFAFVTMVRPEDADAAMQVLNGFELHGRAMSVNMVSRLSFLPQHSREYYVVESVP
jgi:RNA recognition motif-containing protein